VAHRGDTIARMRPHPSPSLRRLIALLACASLAAGLTGCGSSHPVGAGSDPAQVIPANAPLYAAAIVRPSGSLQASAQALGQTLAHERDPYLRLLGALQTPGSPRLDFKRDLAPWLGAQAGIFASALGASGHLDLAPLFDPLRGLLSGSNVTFPFAARGGGAGASATQGAIVLDTTDSHAAQSFLDVQARRAGARATSYRGVAYKATTDGVAFALVDRFAIIGSDPALHGVIDTAAGGASLARSSAYASLRAQAPAQALAHLYLGAGAIAGGGSGSLASAAPGLLALLTGGRTANVSLLPSRGSIALDLDTIASTPSAPTAGLLSPGAEGGRALGELPGDSYVAIGLGASTLSPFVQALRRLLSPAAPTAPTAGISLQGLLGALLAPVSAMTENSAAARRDFQSWMGPGALFASGSGLVDLKAGLVISSKNPALSRAAVAKLAARLRSSGGSVRATSIPGTDAALSATLSGLPVELVIADGRDATGQTKFVIGLGEPSVAAALTPSSALSAASTYGAAGAALGEGLQPSLILEPPTLLSLLEGAGLSEDPTIAPILPYLRPLTTIAGGTKSLGSPVERLRLVLSLRGG
jgi:hypothetical protein